MGLFVGNKPVDMFSLLHKPGNVQAVLDLPDISTLSVNDKGRAFCILAGGDTSYTVGHIYQVTLDGDQLRYEDLNAGGGGISAFYNSTTKELIV